MLGSVDGDDDAVGIELADGSEDGLLLDAAIAGLSFNRITSSLDSISAFSKKAATTSNPNPSSILVLVELPPVTTTTTLTSII
jgi:hypothetical protein